MPGQTEDAEEITVVERRFVLVTHRRKKYRCRCNGCVETAPGPLRLTARPDVRGRRYAPEFAVEVAISKYHRTVAVVDLAFLARRGDDHGVRVGRRLAAQHAHETPHAGVAGRGAVLVDQVLPDRHGVAAAAEGQLDQLSVRLVRSPLMG